MIRKGESNDLDAVMQIWLDTNMEAHSFIPEQYWLNNFDAVAAMIPQSELLIHENEGIVEGFIGMNGEYVEGIFVRRQARSGGIGHSLLRYAGNDKKRLTLRVYQKNIRAVEFYIRESFVIRSEDIDENTGEKEYVMVWER